MIYKKLNKRYAVISYLLVVCTLISSFSLPIFAQEVGEIVEEEPLGSIDAGTMPGAGEADPLAYPDPPYEASILDGAICGFKNKASARFLTIDTGNTASGTNVYQYKNVDTVYPNSQVFYIQYLEKPGVFYIHALNTSGETASTRLKYSPSAATSGTASNLQLMYMMPTENTDQWLIQPVGDGSYFKIVSYANQSLCITSYGTSNGTASGTGTSSAGNVYVSTYTGSDNQLWEIYSGWQPLAVYGDDISSDTINNTTYTMIMGFNVVELCLPITTYRDTIKWTSSNETVAKVSAGCVNPFQPGKTTITATVLNSAGTTKNQYSVTVQVLPYNEYYFIQSVTTTKYASIEGSSASSGAYIEQNDIVNTSFWNVQYDIFNHYYTIRSAYSGLYLSANASGQIVQSTLSNYSKWEISVTSSGNIKLICQANGQALATSSNSSSNGLNLTQLTYRDDANYRDEWKIVRGNVMNVDVMIDESYKEKNTNYSARLNNEFQKVQEKFLNDFNVLVLESSATSFKSWGDVCDDLTGGDYKSPCNHCDPTHTSYDLCSASCCKNSSSISGTGLKEVHHKNLYNIIYRVPFPDTSQTVRAVFTSHDVCQVEGNKHYNNTEGVAWDLFGMVLVAAIECDETNVLMHELGHLYGAKDHYGIGSVPSTDDMYDIDSRYYSTCIYGEDKDTPYVSSNLILCGACEANIQANISKYKH